MVLIALSYVGDPLRLPSQERRGRMPEHPYPCLQCGRPTWNIDKYIVCDQCLMDLEDDPLLLAMFEEERRQRRSIQPLVVPLSPDERRERLRDLLDSW